MVSEKKFQEVLNEISEESCACHGKHCTFRLIIEHQHFNIRTLIQLQAILKFKYEESERQGRDIAEDASMLWFESGLAERFAEVYDEKLTFRQIYKRVMEAYNPVTRKVE